MQIERKQEILKFNTSRKVTFQLSVYDWLKILLFLKPMIRRKMKDKNQFNKATLPWHESSFYQEPSWIF